MGTYRNPPRFNAEQQRIRDTSPLFTDNPQAPPSPLIQQLRDRWTPGPDLSKDPQLWVSARFPTTPHSFPPDPGIQLWSRQREVLLSVVQNTNTAVKSCHSAGKSFLSAIAALWWIDSHPTGEAFVVTSAPTGDQIKAILWRELTRMHSRAKLPGRLNQTEWFHSNGEMVAIGRKPNEYEPTAFQGIHARYVLVILDEACGIPRSLFDAASTLTSNENGRILAVGNPDDPHSYFAQVCQLSSWNVIQISAFDTPNFTDEPVSDLVRDSLISPRWAKDKAEEWGETSPLYSSKILGEFPTESEDGVIPASFIAQCRRLELEDPYTPTHKVPVHLGIDVGAGGDRTVIRERRGKKAGRRFSTSTSDSERVVDLALKAIHETKAHVVKVDSNGIGWGVYGSLRRKCKEQGLKTRIVPINVSEKPRNTRQFYNLRAEMWWNVGRELSRKQEWDLSEIDDATAAELMEPKYRIANGKILVEPKKEVKKRLGRSPDEADALLLAFLPSATANQATSGASALLQQSSQFKPQEHYDGVTL